MKFGRPWDEAASGARTPTSGSWARPSARSTPEVRMTFHHEPRGGGIDNPAAARSRGPGPTCAPYNVIALTSDVPKRRPRPDRQRLPLVAESRGQEAHRRRARPCTTPRLPGRERRARRGLLRRIHQRARRRARAREDAQLRRLGAPPRLLRQARRRGVELRRRLDVAPTLGAPDRRPRGGVGVAERDPAAYNRERPADELDGAWELRPRARRGSRRRSGTCPSPRRSPAGDGTP